MLSNNNKQGTNDTATWLTPQYRHIYLQINDTDTYTKTDVTV